MALVVAGTGTDVGKTLASALIMAKYARHGARYLKPVQTGDTSDRAVVADLAGLQQDQALSEIYSFSTAASPHYAAELANTIIEPHHLVQQIKNSGRALVVELAGGLMVPLTRNYTNLDLLRDLRFPVVLVASTGLGTINHSLLSHAALTQAGLSVCGFIFVGKAGPLKEDNIRTVLQLAGAGYLGELLLNESGHLDAAAMRQLAAGFDAAETLRQYLA
ncbi:dethiobiotin synthase [Turneriella parva]|uniref:ATP-dependent dethiobiotin synthetase BioD n=1 Tax=Turneriella parva (strain ATCC BAA-1111 / DSM 21527 / NCTC 11395 / H) TaxID=869212 RepID=I4BAM6_TURPD|nr:dethiobiotin synthase [Turneriella parva]AFM14333.1 dethiobiotin synthase [Turneriella parva DSM 21527]